MKSTMKGMGKPSTRQPKMTGSAAGGLGRIEKSASAPGKNTAMRLNK